MLGSLGEVMGRAVGISRREKKELKVFKRISQICKPRHGKINGIKIEAQICSRGIDPDPG